MSTIVAVVKNNKACIAADSLTIEITGDENKINSLLNLLRGFGIKEISKTGRIAMARGSASPLPVEKKPAKTRAKGQKKTK